MGGISIGTGKELRRFSGFQKAFGRVSICIHYQNCLGRETLHNSGPQTNQGVLIISAKRAIKAPHTNWDQTFPGSPGTHIVGPWVIDSINLYRDLRTGTQYTGNWASRVCWVEYWSILQAL